MLSTTSIHTPYHRTIGKEISARCSSGSKSQRFTAWFEIISLVEEQLASGFGLESPCKTKQKYTNASADLRPVLRIFAASSTAWWCKPILKPFQLPSASKIKHILSQVYVRLSFSSFPEGIQRQYCARKAFVANTTPSAKF